MYECFHCLSRSVIWDADFTFEDYGLEGEGLVHHCHCSNCGAEIEYYVPITEEDITELEERFGGKDQGGLIMFRTVPKEEMLYVTERRRTNKLEALLEEFIKMNVECVEFENHTYKSSASGTNCLRRAVERYHLNSIEVIDTNGKIYLVNHNVTKER